MAFLKKIRRFINEGAAKLDTYLREMSDEQAQAHLQLTQKARNYWIALTVFGYLFFCDADWLVFQRSFFSLWVLIGVLLIIIFFESPKSSGAYRISKTTLKAMQKERIILWCLFIPLLFVIYGL